MLRDDFLADNFLSDDERYPCSERVSTSARPDPQLGCGRWLRADVQPWVQTQPGGTEQAFDHDKDGKPIPLYNPLTGKHDIKFTAKKLFYRTPTLVEHLGDLALPAQQLGRVVQRRPVPGRPHGCV